jgi:hypothetical protein
VAQSESIVPDARAQLRNLIGIGGAGKQCGDDRATRHLSFDAQRRRCRRVVHANVCRGGFVIRVVDKEICTTIATIKQIISFKCVSELKIYDIVGFDHYQKIHMRLNVIHHLHKTK